MNPEAFFIFYNMLTSNECHNYGIIAGCNEYCPVFQRGGCEVFYENLLSFIKAGCYDYLDAKDIVESYEDKLSEAQFKTLFDLIERCYDMNFKFNFKTGKFAKGGREIKVGNTIKRLYMYEVSRKDNGVVYAHILDGSGYHLTLKDLNNQFTIVD